MPNSLRQRHKMYVINYFIPFLLPHQKNKIKSLVCEKKDHIFRWYNSRLITADTGGVPICHETDFFHLDFPVSDQKLTPYLNVL